MGGGCRGGSYTLPFGGGGYQRVGHIPCGGGVSKGRLPTLWRGVSKGSGKSEIFRILDVARKSDSLSPIG